MKIRHFIIGLAGALFALSAHATDVGLSGVFGGKAALLIIDGGNPTVIRVGQTKQGVTVISVGEGQAVVEVGGKRETIRIGAYSSGASRDTRQKITLASDLAGHFYANGQVNGGPVRFLVDTGATTVALPADIADRLGIDYRKGRRGLIQTANGTTVAYGIKLDEVKLGAITLHNVDAVVIAHGLGIALLGMSFLNRVEMQRNGQSMVLTRRY